MSFIVVVVLVADVTDTAPAVRNMEIRLLPHGCAVLRAGGCSTRHVAISRVGRAPWRVAGDHRRNRKKDDTIQIISSHPGAKYEDTAPASRIPPTEAAHEACTGHRCKLDRRKVRKYELFGARAKVELTGSMIHKGQVQMKETGGEQVTVNSWLKRDRVKGKRCSFFSLFFFSRGRTFPRAKDRRFPTPPDPI